MPLSQMISLPAVFGLGVTLLLGLGLTCFRWRKEVHQLSARCTLLEEQRDAIAGQLVDSEQRLSLALEATAAGYYDLNVERMETQWNDRMFELWGFEKSDTISYEKFMSGIHPDDRSTARQRLAEAMRPDSDGSYSTRYRVINCKDGSIRTVQSDGRYVRTSASGQRIVGLVRDVSDYVQAIEAARNSESLQRAFLDYSNVIGWMKDSNGRYVYVSDSLARRFGISRDSILGKTDSECWSEESAHAFRDSDLDILQSGGAKELTEEHIDKSGVRTSWLINKFCFSDAKNDKFIGGLGIDITERIRNEVKLQESETRFRQVVDLCPDTIVIVRDGQLEFVSATGKQLFGVSNPETWLNRAALIAEPPDDQNGAVALLKQLQNGHSLPPTEMRLMRIDGEIRDIEAAAVPFRDQRGPAILALLRDISARKAIEVARQESDARLHAFLNVSKLLAWMKDSDGRFVYLSDTCSKLSAKFATLPVGKRSRDLWSSTVASRFEAADACVLAEGSFHESIEEVRFDDGRTSVFLVNRFPYTDQSGNRFIGGVALDISESAEVLAAHDELRTWSRALQAAQEDERKRLASELHDEMGSILAVLKSQLALLRGNAARTVQSEDLLLRQIDGLIDSLLATTDRIIEGLRPPVLEHLGLRAALERLALQYESAHHINCELSLPPSEPLLSPDQSIALYRICQEGLTNVVKHASASQVSIALKVLDDVVEMTVSDDGRGMTYPASGRLGYGLIGMRERAGLVGGELAIATNAFGGVLLTVHLPIMAASPIDQEMDIPEPIQARLCGASSPSRTA